MTGLPTRQHHFAAVAFEENLTLRDLLPAYPGAKVGPRDLHVSLEGGGELFIYPFGAIVFYDVPPERREQELQRLNRARPGLTTKVVRESFTVREEPGARVDIVDGTLVVDRFSPERAAVVALIVAQSAAMEYYERIVADLDQLGECGATESDGAPTAEHSRRLVEDPQQTRRLSTREARNHFTRRLQATAKVSHEHCARRIVCKSPRINKSHKQADLHPRFATRNAQ